MRSVQRFFGLLVVSLFASMAPFVVKAQHIPNTSQQAYAEATALVAQAWSDQGESQRTVLLKQAVVLFSAALQQTSTDPNIYIGRGGVYFDLENYEAALADFTLALQIEPRSAIALQNRGVVYEKQGKYREALADLKAALAFIEISLREAPELLPDVKASLSIKRDVLAARVRSIQEQINGQPELDQPSQQVTRSQPVKTPTPGPIQPDVWLWSYWYGQAKYYNYTANGIVRPNNPGWTCGLWSGLSSVEDIVYFTLPRNPDAQSRSAEQWLYQRGVWAPDSTLYHNYAYVTGWTTPAGTSYNYYMLFPERRVCAGENPPSGEFRIKGQFWSY